MNLPSAFAALVLFFTAGALAATDTAFSDSLSDHYPIRGSAWILDGLELEEPVVVWDSAKQRRATIRRTRGDLYPYENQRCVIEIDGDGFDEPRFISARGFRTVSLSWITGKLILVELGVGRVAAVEAVYDAEADDWLYRKSVHFSD